MKSVKIGFVLLTFLWMYPQNIDSQEIDQKKMWEGELRNNPVPKKAIELEKTWEFPNSEDDKNGQYLSVARRFTINKYDKKIYILDSKECKVIAIDNEGRYHGEIGRKGQGPGEFQYPADVFFSNNGKIYVYDSGNGKISVFDSKYQFSSSFMAPRYCQSFCLNSKGFIYANYFGNRNIEEDNLIVVFNDQGELINSFGKRILHGKNASGNRHLSNQAFVDIDENDRVYVLWEHINLFRKYTSEGKILIERSVKDNKLNEISDKNIRTLKTQETNHQMMLYLNRDFVCSNGKLFTIQTYPRLMIYEIAESGEVTNEYWAATPYMFTSSNFDIFIDRGNLRFLVLQTYPDSVLEKYQIKADKMKLDHPDDLSRDGI